MSDNAALEAEAVEAFQLSNHGMKRVRQRLGIPKKAAEREVGRALEVGASRTSFSGRMRRTLDAMFHKFGHYGDYRVYRGHVFVFKGDQFVTVFPLTNGLHNSKAGGRG
ncbi:hypothetical protein JYP46_01280 [Nitratireductor aquimarinus]|uniref:hypothetical protein n=1 Tax=Alphaproteobacteria TaxID=28211 RepID=UPI0019D37458|nr:MULTISPECIES: hypothetical protein [Alphaproteobacteria]MBN7755442.1 hypothetical protein [Nitratireductor aquimarinus]MBY5998197.1 hypothetical protein [Tritonibacter mobilis]MBY6020224.1 hypothetical protein [Nitratireductor sp. DP7N14-4]